MGGLQRMIRTVAPVLLLVAIGAAALAGFLSYRTYPNYDSLYSLVWGREILDGGLPGFDAYRAPTEHPLLVLVSVPLALLGDVGARVLVLICFASMLALLVAMYRLGRASAGLLCALAAAAIVASRLNFWLLASIGFLDLPYCALMAWALALEVERRRRGGVVFLLVGLAGLLRPEAWVAAFAYAAWIAWPLPWAARVRPFLLAAVAPLLWCLVDLVVTGDPLFSIHHTDALAVELVRERPLSTLPRTTVRLLDEILKTPILALGIVGLVAAWRLRARELLVPAAQVAVTVATYLVIASGGLATVYRYLLTAALALALFAAFSLTGWSRLDRGRVRTAWMAVAALAVLGGGGYTVVKTSPAKVRAELRERERIRDDLASLLHDPAVVRARRCGPVTTPNHKLVPDIRWILDAPAGAVRARSQRGPQPRGGVALIVDRRFERRPALNVYEVPADDGARLQTPPADFRLAAGNRTFAAYVRCGGT